MNNEDKAKKVALLKKQISSLQEEINKVENSEHFEIEKKYDKEIKELVKEFKKYKKPIKVKIQIYHNLFAEFYIYWRSDDYKVDISENSYVHNISCKDDHLKIFDVDLFGDFLQQQFEDENSKFSKAIEKEKTVKEYLSNVQKIVNKLRDLEKRIAKENDGYEIYLFEVMEEYDAITLF